MKTKERKTTSAGRTTLGRARAEKKATKVFYAKLQKAVDGVDWGKVKLPRVR